MAGGKEQFESVSVNGMIASAKRLVEIHAGRTKHLPHLLRSAKMASYQQAVDDMLISMDLHKLNEKKIEELKIG